MITAKNEKAEISINSSLFKPIGSIHIDLTEYDEEDKDTDAMRREDLLVDEALKNMYKIMKLPSRQSPLKRRSNRQ